MQQIVIVSTWQRYSIRCKKVENDMNMEQIKEDNPDESSKEILQSIPQEELCIFIAKMMEKDVSFQNSVKAQFPEFFSSNVDSYLLEWESILVDAKREKGYIDYRSSFDFEENTIHFLSNVEELCTSQPGECFRICSTIYDSLATMEIDGSSGCVTTIAEKIQMILKQLLQCENENVIAEIRSWLKSSINDSELADYCLDEGLDSLYIESTPLSQRIQVVKDLIKCDTSDEYTLHEGSYVSNLLNAFEDTNMSDEQIYNEIITYRDYTPARDWIIRYLLKEKRINEAIEYLKEGCCKDAWNEYKYMKWLISIYKEYGYDREYDMEMRTYIASNADDTFIFYEQFRKQFTELEWKEKRNKILSTIHKKTTLAKCYHLEEMVEQLMELFQNEDISIFYLKEYEDLLLKHDNYWVFNQFIKECDNLCREASNNNYEQIFKILKHLEQLPNGEEVALRKRDDLLKEYHRRPNLVKLLKTV